MNQKRFFQIIYIILFSLFLSACASLTTSPVLSWPVRQQQLNAVKQWNLKGSIHINDRLDNTTRSGTASFNWRQRCNNYTLNLLGTLGIGSAQIQGSPQNVILKTSNNERYEAPDADQLVARYLGWSLPITNLYYWIRGLPAPNVTITTRAFDRAQRLRKLQQQGWTIDYLNYRVINGIELPQQILLTREQLNIRITTRRWEPTPSKTACAIEGP